MKYWKTSPLYRQLQLHSNNNNNSKPASRNTWVSAKIKSNKSFVEIKNGKENKYVVGIFF